MCGKFCCCVSDFRKAVIVIAAYGVFTGLTIIAYVLALMYYDDITKPHIQENGFLKDLAWTSVTTGALATVASLLMSFVTCSRDEVSVATIIALLAVMIPTLIVFKVERFSYKKDQPLFLSDNSIHT